MTLIKVTSLVSPGYTTTLIMTFDFQVSSTTTGLMMARWKIVLLLFVISVFGFALSDEITSSCGTIHELGGATATFQSPQCSHGSLSLSENFPVNQTGVSCFWVNQFAQKHKLSPEDLVICDLNMEIRFYGQNSSKNTTVGMVVVFDRLEHETISKMPSEFVKELFLGHVHLVWNEMHASHACTDAPCHNLELKPQNSEVVKRVDGISSVVFDNTTLKMILREALLRTVRELSSTFSGGSGPNDLVLGCPKIVILVKGQVLVVNGCESKAFLCSVSRFAKEEARFPNWCISPFDNQPILDPSGSYMTRRNGDVDAVSVSDWQTLTEDDYFLVVSSSGFSDWLRFTGQNACRFIREHRMYKKTKTLETMQAGCSYPVSYADLILDAWLLASTGNFLVVPLEPAGFL